MAKDKEPKEQKRQDAKPKGDAEKVAAQPKPAQQEGRRARRSVQGGADREGRGSRIPAPPARLATYYREKVVLT